MNRRGEKENSPRRIRSAARMPRKRNKELGLSEARFHELRQEWLQVSCAALEPKPLGRPRETTVEDEVEMLRLHRENENLKMHLRAAQIREEISIAMPHVLQPRKDPPESKKKT